MTKVVFTKQRGAFRSVSVTGHAEVDQEATFIRIVLPDGLTADEAREAQHALRALRVHYGELEKEYAQFIHVTEVQHDA